MCKTGVWGMKSPRHLQQPHGSYLTASLLAMQMRLSLYHMNTCIWYFYRKDNKVHWFQTQMNDAQDNPYLYKELREGKGETVVSGEFSESPWNLRVCFPKTKFKSTLPAHRKLTGATEGCRHLRFPRKHRKALGRR